MMTLNMLNKSLPSNCGEVSWTFFSFSWLSPALSTHCLRLCHSEIQALLLFFKVMILSSSSQRWSFILHWDRRNQAWVIKNRFMFLHYVIFVHLNAEFLKSTPADLLKPYLSSLLSTKRITYLCFNFVVSYIGLLLTP